MAGQKYNKAYEAYQQAVYRDGRNPTFWCSIGVLYFQINQFRDALDAYSRAIRINPYISEVWFDLGSLYESCNNQISDAIDAYARASELDPGNPVISQRLQLLKTAQATGGQLPAAPGPQDVHPTAYASAVVPPPGLTGPPLMLQPSANRPIFRTDSRGPPPEGGLPLPTGPSSNTGRNSPGPFRGGPPPPVVLDESRLPPQTPLAPMMDVDRYPGSSRDGPNRGPSGHHSLLLHQPVPQQQIPEELRAPHNHPEYLGRPLRIPSRSVSPVNRPRSPLFQSTSQRYPHPVGPAQPSVPPSQRSPRAFTHEVGRPTDPEAVWDRRGPPPDHHREWERERRGRHSSEYSGPPPPPPPYHTSRSPPSHRGYSPGPSPHSVHPPRQYWDSKPATGPSSHTRSPPHHRYDPRYDGRDERVERGYGSPEGVRSGGPNAPRLVGSNVHGSESPHPMPVPESKERRRRPAKDKEADIMPPAGGQEVPPKKERKRRTTTKRPKEDQETLKTFAAERGPANLPASFKGSGKDTPEPSSSNGSASSNRPSPPGPILRPPARVVDEDYDEPAVVETLMGLASYRASDVPASGNGQMQSPTVSSSGRGQALSPRPSNRSSESSSTSRSRQSPPSRANSLKRPLSSGPEELGDNKRSRVDVMMHKQSPPSGGRRTPIPSTRPSPIPFRTQPSHSPEIRQSMNDPQPYPSSPPLPAILPPHPRPVGAGLSSHSSNNNSNSINLPPIATLSPSSSTAPSHPSPTADDRMVVDSARSISPHSRARLSDVIHPSTRTPPKRTTPSPASSGHGQMEVSA